MLKRLPDRIIVAAFVAFALTSLLIMLTSWTPYGDLNHWTYDFLINHGRYAPEAKNIVFVDFDNRTFSKIDKYPIPRADIASVIEKISQAKPAVIGVDIFLSEPRAKDQDDAMQKALTDAGNVVIAAQSGTGQLPPVMPLAMFCQPENPDYITGYCKQGTPGAFAYAAINMPIDSDGFVRQAELFAWGKKPAESFPVFMAEEYLAQTDPNCKNCMLQPLNKHAAQFLGHAVPYANPLTRTFRIGDWSPNPVEHISAWDVLQDKVPASELANKLILIGQSSDAARDQHFTPLFRVRGPDGKRERIAGTELHAEAIETLLHGDAIGAIPHWGQEVITLLLLGMATWLFTTTRIRYSAFIALGFMLVTYLVAQLLFTEFHIWFPWLAPEIGLAASLPCGIGWQYLKANVLRSETEKSRQQLMDLFSRYVDPEVARTIWLRRDEVSLQGDEHVATVLFSDIRNFTAMTAGKPSQQVLSWLNHYLTAMDDVIREYNGFLNKFIGDGIMVIYGVPLSNGDEHDACQAVSTALAMLERVKQLNAERRPDDPFSDLSIGVGIHTGMLTCGSVGSKSRLEYSVIGETVNLASRLESLNKEFHTEIIMSESTYTLVKDRFRNAYSLGATPVRGFGDQVNIYSIGPKVNQGETAQQQKKPEVVV
ncbi:MAG: CHASE2 domain-containing protein [Acidobacteriaceae bacterium]